MATIDLQPVQPSDVPAFVRLELDAFKSHPRTPMIWTQGYTPALYAYSEARKHARFAEPECRFMKAVDAATGEMLGVSEWTFSLDAEKIIAETPPDPNELPPADWPEGGNWAMRVWFKVNSFNVMKEELKGRPHILLDILTVSPQVHARGIGSKLLSYGVTEADRLGVRMCLESTPAGLALYQKFGFVPVRYIRADMHQFGWTEPYDEIAAQRVFMIREPRPRADQDAAIET